MKSKQKLINEQRDEISRLKQLVLDLREQLINKIFNKQTNKGETK